MKNHKVTMGEKIKGRRKELNMSVDDLAAFSGVSKSTITKIEANINTNPTSSTISKLAKALKVEPEYLTEDSYMYDILEDEIYGHLPEDVKEWLKKRESRPFVLFAKQLSEGDINPETIEIIVATLKAYMKNH